MATVITNLSDALIHVSIPAGATTLEYDIPKRYVTLSVDEPVLTIRWHLYELGQTQKELNITYTDVSSPVAASATALAVIVQGWIDEIFTPPTGTGDVVGPGISVDNDIVLFDGTTGKLIKDSGKKFNDSGTSTNDVWTASKSKSYADGLVVGLWDDRGSFDASGGAYPSTGGSGTAGAILKGDAWTISVAGTLPTGQVVGVGDLVRALVDTPGNTQANWAITENNIGFVPENVANKDTDGTLAANSDTKYASQKAVKTYVDNSVGGISSFTDEKAQDAVGNSFDNSTLEYVDATPIFKVKDDGITNAKLANMANSTIKGRTTAGTGDPEDLTAAQGRTVLSTRFNICYQGNAFNPADSLTYYLSNVQFAPNSTSTSVPYITIPIGCVLKEVGITCMVNGTLGTGESVTVKLWDNIGAASLGTLSTSFTMSAKQSSQSVTGLSIAITANQQTSIRVEMPVFATNPTGCYFTINCLFE